MVNLGSSDDCASLCTGDSWVPANVCGLGLGYYADGFFDRRRIETAYGSWTSTNAAAVSLNNDDVAYCGVLFFNSITKASLFLPAAGIRYPYGGGPYYGGANGYYWGSGPHDNNGNACLMNLGNGSKTNLACGMPIRCVAE